jgi:hypothetical protein
MPGLIFVLPELVIKPSLNSKLIPAHARTSMDGPTGTDPSSASAPNPGSPATTPTGSAPPPSTSAGNEASGTSPGAAANSSS